MDETVCGPAWLTNETVVFGTPAGMVRVGIFVMVTAVELVTNEVTISGISGEVTVAGVSELDSPPGLVAVVGMVSVSLCETFKIVLGTVALVSAG